VQGRRRLDERVVLIRYLFLRRRHHTAEIFFDHGDGAGEQVPQVVGKIGVDAGLERVVGKNAVRAEGHLAQQEIPYGVHAVSIAQDLGVYHVPLGLGHLAALEYQPAVAVEAPSA